MTSSGIFPWVARAASRPLSSMHAGKLPHALLIRGRFGDGAIQLAEIIAKARLCESLSIGGACGRCKSCQLFDAETHPDFRYLRPDDGVRTIKIDQIRALVTSIDKTAQMSTAKVSVIAPANTMTIGASNALLKTLEEPSGNALMVLVIASNQRVSATVRSRCSLLELPRPAWPEVAQWLQGNGATDAQIALLKSRDAGPLDLAKCETEAQELHILKQQLDAWESGRATLSDTVQAVQAMELETALTQLQSTLAERISTAARGGNRVSMRTFKLYDTLLQAVSERRNGLNTTPILILESLLIQWRQTIVDLV